MSIFEVCMVVMAVSTVAGAVTAAAKNLMHMAGIKKATKLADQAGAGAIVGASIGAAIEALLNSNSDLKSKLAEKKNNDLIHTLESLTKVMQRQERELTQARRPPARLWTWFKSQFPKKPDA